ncbi:MAG TPA: NTP transferase domain-containing protein [Tepidisphaeraceae bacterium]|jgi:molybdopterin-guanine dinucleotide biosynthesis protein A|nr:NTP transferase domain-containing protein [Tepidisphaeraceae bacterium]
MQSHREVSRTDTSVNDVTLAILAGGEGSRMGMAKGHLTVDSKPILDYLIDKIVWPGPTMLVTAPSREHPPGCGRFGMEVCDPQGGGGPLRGVLTALEHLTTPLLLVSTVDMPGIGLPQCKFLIDAMRENQSVLGAMMSRRIVAPASTDANSSRQDSQIEPFPCAFRAGAAKVIARRLGEKRRSIHGLLDESNFIDVTAPAQWNKIVWTNLNSSDDIAAFELGRKH